MKLLHICMAIVFMAIFLNTCSASSNRVADVLAVIATNKLKTSIRYLLGKELFNRVEDTLFPETSALNQNRARNETRQSSSKTGPRVQTNEGLVIGETTENSHAFYGVPYGAPPTGSKR